jgi:hypothetical protein
MSGSKRHYYVARVDILLIAVALIVGKVSKSNSWRVHNGKFQKAL